LYFLKCDSNSENIIIVISNIAGGKKDKPTFKDFEDVSFKLDKEMKYMIKYINKLKIKAIFVESKND
jgi:hypothetical protein